MLLQEAEIENAGDWDWVEEVEMVEEVKMVKIEMVKETGHTLYFIEEPRV